MHGFRVGQVAFYAIIGIVLLVIALAAVLFYRYNLNVQANQKEGIDSATAKDPVYQYVRQCLDKVSGDALSLIGEQGGYYDLQKAGIKVGDEPTSSKAFLLNPSHDPDASDKEARAEAIPYYFYMSSHNGCLQGCRLSYGMPYLYKDQGSPSIEGELDSYINDNFEKCIANFSVLEGIGYDVRAIGMPKADSRANEGTATFRLTYPIQVKLPNREYKLSDFYVEKKVSLPQIYSMAFELTVLEKEYRYLEMQALNLISGYGSINGDIPPMSDATFKFGEAGKVWVKSKVKDKVGEILSKYTGMLQVVGSRNYRSLGGDIVEKKMLGDQMRILVSQDYGLDVGFTYLSWWPIYFDMNCDGEVCTADSFSNSFMMLIGMQRYRFFYTLSYPVLVKLHDPSALDGEGYDFYFGLESNLRYNDPLPEGDYMFTDLIQAGEGDFTCDLDQRNSGNYTFKVLDSRTGKGVENATIMFSCGEDSCTIKNLANASTFEGRLPVCAAGTLSVMKQGYLPISVTLVTEMDKQRNLGLINMQELRSINLSIAKMRFAKNQGGAWEYTGDAPLSDNQYGAVFIKSIEAGADSSLNIVASMDWQNQSQEIEIAPGTYSIDATFMDKSRIIIPEEERSVGSILGQSKYTMPGIEFNSSAPFLLGGLKGNFTITPDVLYSQNSLVLRIVTFELGSLAEKERKIEDLEVMGWTQNYSQKYHGSLGFIPG